jgi:ABC-2 type transport system ATP-binding protein
MEVWGSIRSLVGSGTTVLLTTQYLEEADRLADQIALIDAGRVVADGTPDELKAKVGPDRVETVTRKPTLDEVFLQLTGRPMSTRPRRRPHDHHPDEHRPADALALRTAA